MRTIAEQSRQNIILRKLFAFVCVFAMVFQFANVTAFAAANGFIPLNLEFSPIKGPEGNIEYLLHLRKSDEEPGELPFNIREIVEKAHEML